MICVRCELDKEEIFREYKIKFIGKGICVDCKKKEDRERHANSMIKNPELHKNRKHHRKFKEYGITELDYFCMLVKQNGVCKICERPPQKNRLSIDHDHKTGEVRGLLCNKCNSALGLFNDDFNTLLVAVEYLKSSKLQEPIH